MQNLIEQEISQLTQVNQSIVISNNDDLKKVTACIKGIKSLQDKVKESYDPIVEKAHQSHKEAIAQRDKYLKPLKDVENKYKLAIVAYNQKIEAEQRERERIANEELAKIAEENKKKLIEQSQSTDNEWEAEVLKEQAQEIKPITVDVQKKVIEQEGLSIRKTWKARVVDLDKLPKAYMLVNESLLNQCAKNESFRKEGIAGVEFYEESSASVRV